MRNDRKPLVLYLCDGKVPKCAGIKGCMKDCYHTADISHAKDNPDMLKDHNDSRIFRKYVTNDGDVLFWQRRFASSGTGTTESS